MNLFTTLDPAVKKLLGWRMGDDEEKWALKAIESLVKKLRKRKNQGSTFGTIEDLVSHRKGLPHVIYCRVWRWPSLQSHHELRPVPSCLYPYDTKQEHICINPYHYQRVEQPTFHNGLVVNGHTTAAPTTEQRRLLLPPPPLTLPPQQSASTYQEQLAMEQDGIQILHESTHQYGQNSTPSSTPTASERHTSYSPTGSAFFSVKSGFSSAASPSALSDDDEQMLLACTNDAAQCNIPLSVTNANVNMEMTAPARFNMAEPWCSVAYYELNSRVGQTFRVSVPNVVIDGGVDPGGSGAVSGYEERICLGTLSNVNRNNTIEATRRHIGKGIRLVNAGTQLILNNMSGGSMFLQSRNANFKLNLQPTAVCRVPTHSSLVMFDLQLFSNMLEKARCQGYHQVYEMQKMCFIRVSFIKGWGADYHRQDITSTPWIDSMLSTMEPPSHLSATSVS